MWCGLAGSKALAIRAVTHPGYTRLTAKTLDPRLTQPPPFLACMIQHMFTILEPFMSRNISFRSLFYTACELLCTFITKQQLSNDTNLYVDRQTAF